MKQFPVIRAKSITRRRKEFRERKTVQIACVTSEGVTFVSNMAAGEYLLCFSEKCNREDVKQYFVNCLSREKFSVTRQEFEGKTLLIISAPFSVLAEKVLTEPCIDRTHAEFVLQFKMDCSCG